MFGSGWSVMKTWKRQPSASVKRSWAPECGRSRRQIARVPGGQPVYATLPKAQPTASRDAVPHDRVRYDRIDNSGCVTLRVDGRLHHLGVGRTHARTHVVLLVQDLHVRVVNAATGELLRELVLDPTKDYQPTGAPKGPTRKQPARTHDRGFGPSPIS